MCLPARGRMLPYCFPALQDFVSAEKPGNKATETSLSTAGRNHGLTSTITAPWGGPGRTPGPTHPQHSSLEAAFISQKHEVFSFTEALSSLTRYLEGKSVPERTTFPCPLIQTKSVLVRHNKTKEAQHLHLFSLQVISQTRGLENGEVVICFSECSAPE